MKKIVVRFNENWSRHLPRNLGFWSRFGVVFFVKSTFMHKDVLKPRFDEDFLVVSTLDSMFMH